MTQDLKRRALSALIWSGIQSVGLKFSGILTFLVLTRFLSPADLGLASSVALVLAFVSVVSEQGFPAAIVQRKDLSQGELNILFVVAVATAFMASIVLFFFAEQIAKLIKADGAQSLIRFSAVIPPISLFLGFEVAVRRRNLDFKSIAKASLLSAFLSGLISIYAAAAGYGALSLIILSASTALITSLLLFRNSAWSFKFYFSSRNFFEIQRFSLAVFVSRMIDFSSGRIIDFLILDKFGFVGLGLYTVGSRIYQAILQTLSSTLIDVSTSTFSRMNGDTPRLRAAYQRLLFVASNTTLPAFVFFAALAPEVSGFFFGREWTGVEDIMALLCVLGGIQVVQFFNGSVLMGAGHSNSVMFINATKLLSAVFSLLLVRSNDIVSMTLCFVLSQLFVSPVSFILAARLLESRLLDLPKHILGGSLAAAGGFATVFVLRTVIASFMFSEYLEFFILMFAYFTVTACLIVALNGAKLLSEIKAIRKV